MPLPSAILGPRPGANPSPTTTLPQDLQPDLPEATQRLVSLLHRPGLDLTGPAASASASASASVPARPLHHGDPAAWLAEAWQACYLKPLVALALGQRVADAGGPTAADGWLQVALGEVRVGDADSAVRATETAQALFAAAGDARGLALCDEVRAIGLRRQGQHDASARLQAAVDARGGFEPTAMHRFLAHNSRAVTCKQLRRIDDALRHFYAALDAAIATGWPGPLVTAQCNLGGYHHDLHNLDDARLLSRQAFDQARRVGAVQIVATAGNNLILTCHFLGQHRAARDTAEALYAWATEIPADGLKRHAPALALAHFGVGEFEAAQAHLDQGAVAAVGDGDGRHLWAWLQARCLLQRGEPAAARALAERTLRHGSGELAQPSDLMALHQVLADACEALGDHQAALGALRQAHHQHEQLVGRSARARFIALEVSHQLALAQRERDLAVAQQRTAERDHQRLSDLNAALQQQMAETRLLQTRLHEQAVRDPLTDLYNRRHLFEAGPALLDLARRRAQSLCVVLIDLDHFKLVNDRHGHAAGDLVLQRFAELLVRTLRSSDLVCRYGGEEFVAVLPDIDVEGAHRALARLLEGWLDIAVDCAGVRLPPGSFSAGLSVFPQHADSLPALLQRADLALYAAKGLGRARIEIATASGLGGLN